MIKDSALQEIMRMGQNDLERVVSLDVIGLTGNTIYDDG